MLHAIFYCCPCWLRHFLAFQGSKRLYLNFLCTTSIKLSCDGLICFSLLNQFDSFLHLFRPEGWECLNDAPIFMEDVFCYCRTLFGASSTGLYQWLPIYRQIWMSVSSVQMNGSFIVNRSIVYIEYGIWWYTFDREILISYPFQFSLAPGIKL